MKIFSICLLLVSVTLLSFTRKTPKKYKGPKSFVFIPSGKASIDDKELSFRSFYMSAHEVTNLEYREFLVSLKESGKNKELELAKPDTTVWNMIPGSYMDPMVEHYFSHPAYDNYPVVGISRLGAEMYAEYVSEQYQEIYGKQIAPFRLPTKGEWIYAAKGGLENSPYPWGGPYLRNAKGCYLANYMPVGDQSIASDQEGNPYIVEETGGRLYDDGAFFTASVNSYFPNDYGLYNMSGNVAELVAKEDIAMGGHWKSTGHDVQVTSAEKFEKANPFTGFRLVQTHVIEK